MMGVRYQNDNRAKFLMSGSPGIKLGMWVAFNVLPFFLPNNVVLTYGYLARVGSVAFLFIQMLLLLDFVLTLNESWVGAAEEDDRHYQAMFGLTAGCYLACLALICALLSTGSDSFFLLDELFPCLCACFLIPSKSLADCSFTISVLLIHTQSTHVPNPHELCKQSLDP